MFHSLNEGFFATDVLEMIRHWADVTCISENLTAKKLSFDITRIRSKSPALKALSMEYITFFKIWDVTIIQNFATLLTFK